MTKNQPWDKSLDYHETYNTLTTALKDAEKVGQKVKISILLITARNGTRIHESVVAFNLFLKEKRHNLEILTQKRKGDNKYYRPITIPDEIELSLPEYKNSDENLCNFSQRYFGFNPHSLRYAFITWSTSKSNPNRIELDVLAKITGHTRLDQLITYVQEKEARRALKEDVI